MICSPCTMCLELNLHVFFCWSSIRPCYSPSPLKPSEHNAFTCSLSLIPYSSLSLSPFPFPSPSLFLFLLYTRSPHVPLYSLSSGMDELVSSYRAGVLALYADGSSYGAAQYAPFMEKKVRTHIFSNS